ncbi:MAG TPA: P-loop NTPase fold protein [Opitutaceae bacterium]
MRIQPPKIEIDDSAPYKEALFDRKAFGESLTTLLRNVEDSLVIFVNAPWGEGKSTFAQMWRAHLRSEKLNAIYFDAYAADYVEDPFVCFSGEILSFVERELSDMEGVQVPKTEFKKTAIEVGKRMVGLVAKVGIRAATMGAVDATHVAELKDIGSDVASGVSDIGSDIIEKKIEHYAAEKDALKAFRRTLGTLAAKVREKQGFPLTIIVDELDRCRPDFALSLLERIKHLFDVEGVAFILLVNRDQIESYVRMVYGESVDARAYLLKFANIFVDLPVQHPMFHRGQGRQEFVRTLIEHYNFSEGIHDGGFFSRSISFLFSHFDLTLREIEKTLLVLSIYYGSLPKNELSNEFLISLLAILKTKRPWFFDRLRRGGVTADEFFKETGLANFREESGDGVSREWVTDMLNYCLMSDEELAKVAGPDAQIGRPTGPARMGSWLVRYSISRQNVIPFFCRRLEQFSAAPR